MPITIEPSGITAFSVIKALITENAVIPDGSMVMGIPAKVKRELSEEEQQLPTLNSKFYVENYKRYKKGDF